jgi:hypothetical protein
MTVQALPDPPRRAAIGQVGRMVAPAGTLLVIAAGHDEAEDPEDGPPWPLTRAEVEAFATGDLRAVRIEDIRDDQDPRELRWRAEFHRPEPPPFSQLALAPYEGLVAVASDCARSSL